MEIFLRELLPLLCVITLTLDLVSSQPQPLQCPPVEEIAPCNCVPLQERAYCFGGDEPFSQSDVDRLVPALRRANKVIGPNEWLYIPRLELMYSDDLTSIDLSSWHNVHVMDLKIINNPLLTTLTVPENWTMAVDNRMTMTENAFTNEGIGPFLKGLVPNMVRLLYLQHNNLQGGHYIDPQGYQEFLPGLNRQRKITSFSFGYNNISDLSDGQFRRLQRVYSLGFSDNPLTSIGENAFLMDEFDSDMNDVLFQVGFGLPYIPDGNIHPNLGLHGFTRPIRFMMIQNYVLDTLSEDNWSWVYNHPNSTMAFYTSTIQCDPRLKWMKDRREDLETKTEGAWCANDVGQTPFTSQLVG